MREMEGMIIQYQQLSLLENIGQGRLEVLKALSFEQKLCMCFVRRRVWESLQGHFDNTTPKNDSSC